MSTPGNIILNLEDVQFFKLPESETVLWDHSVKGNALILDSSFHQKHKVCIKEKVLQWISCMLQTNDSGKVTSCKFVGFLALEESSRGITVFCDKYDEMKTVSHFSSDKLSIPCKINRKTKDEIKWNVDDYYSDLKGLFLHSQNMSHLDMRNFFKIRILSSFCGIQCSLKVEMIMLSALFKAVPIGAVPVHHSSLEAILSNQKEKLEYSGFLSMDANKKLIHLSEWQPDLSALPLVGVWISGVSSLCHPIVWAACVRYISNSSLLKRICLPPLPFLIVLYCHDFLQPQYFDCIYNASHHSWPNFVHFEGCTSLTLPKVPVLDSKVLCVELINGGKSQYMFEASDRLIERQEIPFSPQVIVTNTDDMPISSSHVQYSAKVINHQHQVPDLSVTSTAEDSGSNKRFPDAFEFSCDKGSTEIQPLQQFENLQTNLYDHCGQNSTSIRTFLHNDYRNLHHENSFLLPKGTQSCPYSNFQDNEKYFNQRKGVPTSYSGYLGCQKSFNELSAIETETRLSPYNLKYSETCYNSCEEYPKALPIKTVKNDCGVIFYDPYNENLRHSQTESKKSDSISILNEISVKVIGSDVEKAHDTHKCSSSAKVESGTDKHNHIEPFFRKSCLKKTDNLFKSLKTGTLENFNDSKEKLPKSFSKIPLLQRRYKVGIFNKNSVNAANQQGQGKNGMTKPDTKCNAPKNNCKVAHSLKMQNGVSNSAKSCQPKLTEGKNISETNDLHTTQPMNQKFIHLERPSHRKSVIEKMQINSHDYEMKDKVCAGTNVHVEKSFLEIQNSDEHCAKNFPIFSDKLDHMLNLTACTNKKSANNFNNQSVIENVCRFSSSEVKTNFKPTASIATMTSLTTFGNVKTKKGKNNLNTFSDSDVVHEKISSHGLDSDKKENNYETGMSNSVLLHNNCVQQPNDMVFANILKDSSVFATSSFVEKNHMATSSSSYEKVHTSYHKSENDVHVEMNEISNFIKVYNRECSTVRFDNTQNSNGASQNDIETVEAILKKHGVTRQPSAFLSTQQSIPDGRCEEHGIRKCTCQSCCHPVPPCGDHCHSNLQHKVHMNRIAAEKFKFGRMFSVQSCVLTTKYHEYNISKTDLSQEADSFPAGYPFESIYHPEDGFYKYDFKNKHQNMSALSTTLPSTSFATQNYLNRYGLLLNENVHPDVSEQSYCGITVSTLTHRNENLTSEREMINKNIWLFDEMYRDQ